jgi:hypothetical protein
MKRYDCIREALAVEPCNKKAKTTALLSYLSFKFAFEFYQGAGVAQAV